MTGKEYVDLSMRTNDRKSNKRLNNCLINTRSVNIDYAPLLNACLGLSGEVGEFNDMIKKHIFHEKDIDIEHLKKEMGDIMWYIALACDSLSFDLDEIMQMNVDKLKARYPEGFDVVKSDNRKAGDV